MSPLAEFASEVVPILRGEPTPYEREQIRIIDALIQFEMGKWASLPRTRIPERIIAAALEAYNPALPLSFNSYKGNSPSKKPTPCPNCGSARTARTSWGSEWKYYNCHECWKPFKISTARTMT